MTFGPLVGKERNLAFFFSVLEKIALSKLLQNVESPFRGAAPLKAHIAPQDPAAASFEIHRH